MIHVIVRLAVLALLFVGGREFLEHRATKTLELAQEQSDDEQYTEALTTLRSLESWLSWTRAGAEGDVLRADVRKALQRERQRAEQDAQFKEHRRDMDRRAKERAERLERDRAQERYYAGLDQARREADQDREMKRAKIRAEMIQRNNERALRNARRRN